MVAADDLAAARSRKQRMKTPAQTQRDLVSSALDERRGAILDLVASTDLKPPMAASQLVGRARTKVLDFAAPNTSTGRRFCDGAYCARDAGDCPHTSSAVRH